MRPQATALKIAVAIYFHLPLQGNFVAKMKKHAAASTLRQ